MSGRYDVPTRKLGGFLLFLAQFQIDSIFNSVLGCHWNIQRISLDERLTPSTTVDCMCANWKIVVKCSREHSAMYFMQKNGRVW